MPHDEAEADQLAPSLWDLPLRSYQRGSGVLSAAVSCIRSSRGNWKTCLASRWDAEVDMRWWGASLD